MIFLIGISLVMSAMLCSAQEYFYPVFSIKNNDAQYLYFIHQISLQQLHLLQLNTESKVLTRVLPSAITPAGLKSLPDGSGYSFIDQGQLYVKLFTARSPQKISIPLSLYNIEMVEWIDPYHCYCAAKLNDHWNIYQLSRSGDLVLLAHRDDADCLYPHKVGDSLFFIQRTFTKQYSIECSTYGDTHSCNKHTIFDAGQEAIAFLHMLTNEQGFYVSYANMFSFDSIEKSSLRLGYHRLWYDRQAQRWCNQTLFTFFVPIDLFVPDSHERLYESLLPVLPRHTADGIYFCSSQDPEDHQSAKKACYRGYHIDSCDCERHTAMRTSNAIYRNLGARWYEADPLALYYFDHTHKTITRKAHNNNQDLLAPLLTAQTCFYGYSLEGNSKHKKLLQGMWQNEQGQMSYWPPNFKTTRK